MHGVWVDSFSTRKKSVKAIFTQCSCGRSLVGNPHCLAKGAVSSWFWSESSHDSPAIHDCWVREIIEPESQKSENRSGGKRAAGEVSTTNSTTMWTVLWYKIWLCWTWIWMSKCTSWSHREQLSNVFCACNQMCTTNMLRVASSSRT